MISRMQESVQSIAQFYDEIQIPVTIIAESSNQMFNIDKNLQKLSNEIGGNRTFRHNCTHLRN